VSNSDFIYGQVMQCVVMYAAGISCPQSVLRYKFEILDTYQLDTVFTWTKMWGYVVIFWRQKGSASKKIWETL